MQKQLVLWSIWSILQRCNQLNGTFWQEKLDVLASLIKLFLILVEFFWIDCSLRDEKIKISNFAEEIMPEQYDDGWQQKLRMKTHMVEKLITEIRPFMLQISGIVLFGLFIYVVVWF